MLKLTDTLSFCTSKCAFLVAIELTLDEVLRYCATVDGDKVRVAS